VSNVWQLSFRLGAQRSPGRPYPAPPNAHCQVPRCACIRPDFFRAARLFGRHLRLHRRYLRRPRQARVRSITKQCVSREIQAWSTGRLDRTRALLAVVLYVSSACEIKAAALLELLNGSVPAAVDFVASVFRHATQYKMRQHCSKKTIQPGTAFRAKCGLAGGVPRKGHLRTLGTRGCALQLAGRRAAQGHPRRCKVSFRAQHCGRVRLAAPN
jgi:hypothetical protein